MAIGYEGYKGYGSPEQIAKTRALIDALMTKNRPMTTGDGLVALGDGIVANVLNRRAEESEKAGMADWENTWSSLLSGGDLLGSAATSGVAGELSATSPAVASGEPIDLTGNEVFSGFIDTVREGGVTNPYALAAIAATGKAESGFSPGNVNRTWADPSESGQPGTAGGIMSWRGPRYQALAATGDLSPQGQARFFLQEDPNLIAALNNANSLEEAQSLMNNAWRFAGYDRPGGEAARRLSLANSFLPTFQGQGEVAALTPEAAIEAVAPGSGSVVPPEPQFDAGRFGDPINLAEMPLNAAQLPGALVEQRANYAPPLPPPTNVESRPVASVAEALVQPPVEVAQAGGADYFPPAPTAPSQGGRPSVAQLLAAANHPFAPKAAQGVIGALLEQEMKRNDPLVQLQLQKAQLELDQLRNPRGEIKMAGDRALRIMPDGTVEDVTPGIQGGNTGQFRFSGNSVEAQALNGLMDSGQLTADQAQQIAAGKTVTDPSTGAMIFLTPQGIVGQPANGGAPQIIAPTSPQPSSVPNDAGTLSPTSRTPDPQGQSRPGQIQLTPGKAQLPTEAQRNREATVDQAFKTITGELDRYAELVGRTGIEATPGEAKDNLNTVRQGIMLQLKELFNLGVLNGPDLSLMERMIYDPVVDISKEGGITNLPDQIWTGITGGAGKRATNSVTELKRMLENIRSSVSGASSDAKPTKQDDPLGLRN